MINHVVLLKLKNDTPENQIESLYKNILELRNKIYVIEKITIGSNNSPESKNQGFSHGFIMQFKDEKVAEDVLVFDYEVK